MGGISIAKGGLRKLLDFRKHVLHLISKAATDYNQGKERLKDLEKMTITEKEQRKIASVKLAIEEADDKHRIVYLLSGIL